MINSSIVDVANNPCLWIDIGMNIEYLKESVGKYLCKALCEVVTRRPDRPIEFLAYYLIALYEKDLELQQVDKVIDSKEDKKTFEDFALTPVLSQMFMERLSTSMSKNLEDISPAATSPSTSIGLDMEEERAISDSEKLLTDEDRAISEEKVAVKDREISDEKKGEEKVFLKEEVESIDDAVEKTSTLSLTDLYDIPERSPSAIRDNEPVTETEAKEFGTTDPFLARRNTNLFDVNFAPIGDPSNQPNPPS